MALDDLQQVIEKLQEMIGRHRDYLSENETRTRQVLIDPLLQALGWDVSDPDIVQLEYKVKQKRADYVLMWNGKPIAVIEAKRLGSSIEDNETTQVHAYANQNGIPYMIATDGDRWEMYEVFKQAPLAERQLMKFQLSQQLAHENTLQALRIWKPNLGSGSPTEAMKPVIELPQTVVDPPSSPSNEPQSLPHDPSVDSDLTPTKHLTSTKQLYLEYWTALCTRLEQGEGVIKPVKPNAGHWISFSPFRHGGFGLNASASVKGKFIRVKLIFKGKDAKPHYHRLKQDRIDIEKEIDVEKDIDAELEWSENPNNKESNIKVTLPDTDPETRHDWNQQHEWLCEQLETFCKVFKPRIQALKQKQIFF